MTIGVTIGVRSGGRRMKSSHDARNCAKDSQRYHIGTEFERLFLGVIPGR